MAVKFILAVDSSEQDINLVYKAGLRKHLNRIEKGRIPYIDLKKDEENSAYFISGLTYQNIKLTEFNADETTVLLTTRDYGNRLKEALMGQLANVYFVDSKSTDDVIKQQLSAVIENENLKEENQANPGRNQLLGVFAGFGTSSVFAGAAWFFGGALTGGWGWLVGLAVVLIFSIVALVTGKSMDVLTGKETRSGYELIKSSLPSFLYELKNDSEHVNLEEDTSEDTLEHRLEGNAPLDESESSNIGREIAKEISAADANKKSAKNTTEIKRETEKPAQAVGAAPVEVKPEVKKDKTDAIVAKVVTRSVVPATAENNKASEVNVVKVDTQETAPPIVAKPVEVKLEVEEIKPLVKPVKAAVQTVVPTTSEVKVAEVFGIAKEMVNLGAAERQSEHKEEKTQSTSSGIALINMDDLLKDIRNSSEQTAKLVRSSSEREADTVTVNSAKDGKSPQSKVGMSSSEKTASKIDIKDSKESAVAEKPSQVKIDKEIAPESTAAPKDDFKDFVANLKKSSETVAKLVEDSPEKAPSKVASLNTAKSLTRQSNLGARTAAKETVSNLSVSTTDSAIDSSSTEKTSKTNVKDKDETAKAKRVVRGHTRTPGGSLANPKRESKIAAPNLNPNDSSSTDSTVKKDRRTLALEYSQKMRENKKVKPVDKNTTEIDNNNKVEAGIKEEKRNRANSSSAKIDTAPVPDSEKLNNKTKIAALKTAQTPSKTKPASVPSVSPREARFSRSQPVDSESATKKNRARSASPVVTPSRNPRAITSYAIIAQKLPAAALSPIHGSPPVSPQPNEDLLTSNANVGNVTLDHKEKSSEPSESLEQNVNSSNVKSPMLDMEDIQKGVSQVLETLNEDENLILPSKRLENGAASFAAEDDQPISPPKELENGATSFAAEDDQPTSPPKEENEVASFAAEDDQPTSPPKEENGAASFAAEDDQPTSPPKEENGVASFAAEDDQPTSPPKGLENGATSFAEGVDEPISPPRHIANSTGDSPFPPSPQGEFWDDRAASSPTSVKLKKNADDASKSTSNSEEETYSQEDETYSHAEPFVI